MILNNVKRDITAGIVVFCVGLPLCLGIALTSGAPLMSGIISGIIGGIVIGGLSDSRLGVSEPAAGLAIVVLNSINNLGAWEVFLLAVVICGVLQLIMRYSKAGFIKWDRPRFSKTNGITEGFHRKMKLIQQRAYGFRNFENYRTQ